jgi:hypothetical protein
MNIKMIRAYDFGSKTVYTFSPEYRCGFSPRHLFAPPNFTIETAFSNIYLLDDVSIDDEVFIEWVHDKFYAYNEELEDYVPGFSVWRKAKVLELVFDTADGKDLLSKDD